MKRLLCILMLCSILCAGCSGGNQSGQQSELPRQDEQAQQDEQTLQSELPPTKEMTDQERLAAAEEWLEKDFSFTLTCGYMNLAINGMQQRTEQVFGKDGSWSMLTDRQMWDHRSDYRQEESAQFYYRYEGSQLVCYSVVDGVGPERGVISARERVEMEESKALIVGAPALMPDYLEGLYVTHPEGNEVVTVLAYWLPVDKVMADNTMLSMYINNAFSLSGNTYPPEADAGILALFEVGTQTCQPISLSFMFHEVKPYVLSPGAQSGEAALDTDFMTMSYSFNYDIPDTVAVPEEMIPETF